MTYLDRALAKCALPIRVEYENCLDEWWIYPANTTDDASDVYCRAPAEARAAYLALVAELMP